VQTSSGGNPGAGRPPGGPVAPPPARTGAAERGLTRPEATAWLHEIAAVVGPQQALLAWSRAAQATSLHGVALTPDQLETLGNRLVEDTTDPPLRMAVRSCLLRLRVWRTLERTRGGAR
jgi:hypothetical protein